MISTSSMLSLIELNVLSLVLFILTVSERNSGNIRTERCERSERTSCKWNSFPACDFNFTLTLTSYLFYSFLRDCVLILYSGSLSPSHKGKPGVPIQQIPGHHNPPHAPRKRITKCWYKLKQ